MKERWNTRNSNIYTKRTRSINLIGIERNNKNQKQKTKQEKRNFKNKKLHNPVNHSAKLTFPQLGPLKPAAQEH